MDPYMAADAQGHEQIRLVAPVAMMNHQGRPLATTTAAEAVACQNPLPQSTEKAQRMTAPVVTRAAALPAIGVREAARRDKRTRFTALLHHVTVQRLLDSYYALKREAAPGVDVANERYIE